MIKQLFCSFLLPLPLLLLPPPPPPAPPFPSPPSFQTTCLNRDELIGIRRMVREEGKVYLAEIKKNRLITLAEILHQIRISRKGDPNRKHNQINNMWVKGELSLCLRRL